MHPILFHLGPLSLSTFGVLLAVGLLAGLVLSERTARLAAIEPERLWNAGLFLVVAAFVFSRLLLVVHHWHTFLRFPLLVLALPSLTASGLLLTAAATLIWLNLRKIPLRAAIEAWVPCGLLIWGFLALGHFAEGSDPGMPTRAVWGIHISGSTFAQQPVALLAATSAFVLAALSCRRLQHGRTAGFGLAGAGVAQVLISFLRQPGAEMRWGLDALEWVGIGLIATGGLLAFVHPPRREPGTFSSN